MSYVYEVGDCVYFETTPSAPYLIAKIERFEKSRDGNLIANVRSFFRRRDLPENLLTLADGNTPHLEGEADNDDNRRALNGIQLHQLKHRELFLSEKTDKLLTNLIRGKCQVNLFIEVEGYLTYLENEDMFFYSLVYDHVSKHLTSHRKHVRIGSKYQADIPTPCEIINKRYLQSEIQIWNPRNKLSDMQIDQFLMLCRSAGTFARGVDSICAERCPHLLKTIAFASRDVTSFFAMAILHETNYNMAAAMCLLVPSCRPLLCKDQMEEWSAAEAQMFEDGLAVYDKDFNSIRENVLPWKTLKNIIEYYYMWKTSDRHFKYVQGKFNASECKMKKVFIPGEFAFGEADNDRRVTNGAKHWQAIAAQGAGCVSCDAAKSGWGWFPWGHEQRRVCGACWLYWKKYGGLKKPSDLIDSGGSSKTLRLHRCRFQACLLQFKSKLDLARHYTREHGADLRLLMSSQRSRQKQPFYFRPTPLTRLSRSLCRSSFRARSAARCPTRPLNASLIRQECQRRLADRAGLRLRKRTGGTGKRASITQIIDCLRLACSPT